MVTEDEDNMHFVGSLLEGKLRNVLGVDNTDDQFNGSNSYNQLDDTKVEAMDEDPYKGNPPKEPESLKPVLDGVESSDENEREATPSGATKGDSTGKENSGGFQYIPFLIFKDTLFDYKLIQITNNPLASRNPRMCENDLADPCPG